MVGAVLVWYKHPPLCWQDVTAGPVAAAGKGCYWNQDVPALVKAAQLRTVQQRYALGGLLVLVHAERT